MASTNSGLDHFSDEVVNFGSLFITETRVKEFCEELMISIIGIGEDIIL